MMGDRNRGPDFEILDGDKVVGNAYVRSCGDGTFTTHIRWSLPMQRSEDVFNTLVLSGVNCQLSMRLPLTER